MNEILEILISVFVLSFAFSIFPAPTTFFSFHHFLAIVATVGAGFALHELGHRFVALHFGCKARFRMWSGGLIFALVLSLITQGALIFAAPGAVYIYGKKISKKENGMISAAGPLMNILLAIAFWIFELFFPHFKSVTSIGVIINLWLGFFNLLPVFPLDGEKVKRWDISIWSALLIFSASVYVLYLLF